jgi:hypothetical protein
MRSDGASRAESTARACSQRITIRLRFIEGYLPVPPRIVAPGWLGCANARLSVVLRSKSVAAHRTAAGRRYF